ncbi:MAG: VOC family protein [bacterium]|nr:VOC family protein [bacterium]
MPRISLLQHFSIYCRELEPMHAFYAKVLGMKELPRPHFPFPGHWLEAGPGHHIHLSKLHEGHITHSISDNEDGYTDHHFGLVTDDLEGMKSRLRENAVAFHDEPYGYPQIFFRDPENNLIEVASEKMFAE